MKLCKDCKHFKRSRMGLLCRSPKLGVNLISGEPNVHYALVMREDYKDNSKSCRTEGNWWEPKQPEIVKKPWYKIWEV